MSKFKKSHFIDKSKQKYQEYDKSISTYNKQKQDNEKKNMVTFY